MATDFEYNVAPGCAGAVVSIEFPDGLTVRGDMAKLVLTLDKDEWPNALLDVTLLEVKKHGIKAEFEDLFRVVRFKT